METLGSDGSIGATLALTFVRLLWDYPSRWRWMPALAQDLEGEDVPEVRLKD
jgi:hypothetical protein